MAGSFCISRVIALAMFLTAPGMLFAQAPGALAPLSLPLDADRIGVVAAVKGQVDIKDSRAVGRVAGSGAAVYLGDTVSTNAEGQLQILLKDETIFTIGPNSSIVIDRFIYDPATQDGEVSAQILKGTFRFITGKIAKKKPENMEVKLPVGTIGVRGTMVAGRVDGVKSMAVLLGPGPQNQMGERAGSFILNNTVNNQLQSTHVTGINFGSEIAGAGVPPVPAFRVPDSVIASLCNQFGAPPAVGQEGPVGPGGQPTAPGGQPMGPPGAPIPPPPAVAAFLASLGFPMPPPGEFFDPASVPFFNPQLVLPPNFQNLPPPPDDATTFQQLRSLNDGPFHFEAFGVPTTSSGTTFNFEANINFSFDVFGGVNTNAQGDPIGVASRIWSATSSIGDFSFSLPSTCDTCNYNPDNLFNGPASFFYVNLANSLGGCANCTADVTIGLGNRNADVGIGAGIQDLAVVGVLLTVDIKDASGGILAQVTQPFPHAERQQGAADGNDNPTPPPP